VYIRVRVSSGTIVADAEARAVQATGSIPPVYREGGTTRKIDRERERERERERNLCEGGSKQRRLPLLVYERGVKLNICGKFILISFPYICVCRIARLGKIALKLKQYAKNKMYKK